MVRVAPRRERCARASDQRTARRGDCHRVAGGTIVLSERGPRPEAAEEVDLSIAERDISKLFENQDCRIRAEAFPQRIYQGYVSRIMPMGDRGKSAVPVRVKIDFRPVDAKGQPLLKDTQGQFLRPEMGAIVTFLKPK